MTNTTRHGAHGLERERERAESFDVLVLGASYLGAELTYLLRRRAPELRVCVVDRQRSHGYIPLVHERLVGRIDWEDSRFRTDEFIARQGATFVEGEIVSFEANAKRVVLGDGRSLRARFVVIALGSVTTPPESLPGRAFFVGHKLTPETDDARSVIHRVLSRVGTEDQAPRAIVVGGGISGIELAGELAHLASNRRRLLRAPQVTLVHGADRLVPHLSTRASEAVERSLVAQGVALCHQTRVLGADAEGLRVRDRAGHERTLPSDLSFWCGGVRAPAILSTLGLPLTTDGFLEVSPELACGAASSDIFAGGDCARITDPSDGARWPTMQRAIECLWAAETIARQITTLAREPEGYPHGVPPLARHTLRADFFHGLSLGGTSLVVHGERVVDLGAINIAFRRFLMWGYFRRYGQWSSPLSRFFTRALESP